MKYFALIDKLLESMTINLSIFAIFLPLFQAHYVYKLNTHGRVEIESCVRLMAYGGLTATLVRPNGLTRKGDV